MADIRKLSRLINGVQRQVDLSENTLVVDSLKVGAGEIELTQAILEKLIDIQSAADADGTFDSRYHTQAELGATDGSGGSTLIGDEDDYSNFTPTAATVRGALEGIDTALLTAGSKEFSDDEFEIFNDTDDTKKINFDASQIATGQTRTIIMDDDDVDLADVNNAVLIDGSRAFIDDQSMGDNKLTNLAAPDNDSDAATKKYVDDTVDAIDLSGYVETSQLGVADGVATLDATGRIPSSQLTIDALQYKGVWDADLNDPALADGTGTIGDLYRVNEAGTSDLGSGNITFAVGDKVVYNGSVWEKWNTSELDITSDDVPEGSTNLYFTDTRARDAVVVNTLAGDEDDRAPSVELINDTFGELIDGSNADDLHEHSKLVLDVVVGEAMDADESVLVRWAVDGETAERVYKADMDADGQNHFYVVGIILPDSALSAGNPAKMLMQGVHVLGSGDAAFAAADIGLPVYLGVDGAMTITPPSDSDEAVVRVGIVAATNKVMISGIQLNGIN